MNRVPLTAVTHHPADPADLCGEERASPVPDRQRFASGDRVRDAVAGGKKVVEAVEAEGFGQRFGAVCPTAPVLQSVDEHVDFVAGQVERDLLARRG
jgi:hypothetical protein